MSRRKIQFCPYCAQDAGRGTFCQVCGARLAKRVRQHRARDAAALGLTLAGLIALAIGGAMSACGAVQVAGGTEYGVVFGWLSLLIGVPTAALASLMIIAGRGEPAGMAQVGFGGRSHED